VRSVNDTTEYAVSCSPPYPQLFTGPDLFCSTLFSNALNLCSSFGVRNQVSHACEITSKIKVMCILIFIFLSSKDEHSTGFSKFSFFLISYECKAEIIEMKFKKKIDKLNFMEDKIMPVNMHSDLCTSLAILTF
jgi:hypothetical protein